jgi:hypothetical protein
MGSKTVFFSLETNKSIEQIWQAIKESHVLLGGTVYQQGNGLQIKQGTAGVSFAFAANFDAFVNLRQSGENKYEIITTINWSPNGLLWACLVIGFFVFGILWIVPLLYLFIDPSQVYQQALFRAQSMLN